MPDQLTPPRTYSIGIPGTPWAAPERARWLAGQPRRRDFRSEVLTPLESGLPASAEAFRYGELDYTRLGLGTYPLIAVRSRAWDAQQPTVLVTGGVHGYETSGVQGALQWLTRGFARHAGLNLLVLPCISPWGYETINRWNPDALDPNRQFRDGAVAAEAVAAMACVCAQAPRVDLHIDLHETTDTDESEFGPAKAARDGVAYRPHVIPLGFYLVADADRPEPAFQRSVIDAVRGVTAIAPADADGRMLGDVLQQPGVIAYPKRSLGLCGGMTGARFVTTTEVYPDAPGMTAAECNASQVTAVDAAIAHLLRTPTPVAA